MPLDHERWLTQHGRDITSPQDLPGVRQRLKLVASLLAAAPPAMQDGPRLLTRSGKGTVQEVLLANVVRIGRSVHCELCFADAKMSREHCRLTPSADGVWLEDLKSTNGTWRNDRRVEKALLYDGDIIRIGNCLFAYVHRAAAETKSLGSP